MSTRSLVITYHSAATYRGPRKARRKPSPQATEAGQRMLDAGGTAADAFVAATLAEYVVAEGGTSIAGTLGALVYEARSGAVEYLDGDYNLVQDPRGMWQWRDGIVHTVWSDRVGKATLVPGALGGLEELSRKHGRLGFPRALEPAIELAANGFPLSEFYASVLAWRARVLRRSAYGRRTFFKSDGTPLRAGDTLRQPEVAQFLINVAREGSAYMYAGPWAAECVEVVRKRGGRMTLVDLRRWTPQWHKPWRIAYRGYDLYAPGGRQYGGIWVLLALLALAPANLRSEEHFSRNADALEQVIRTARETWAERKWLEDPSKLDDHRFVARRLTPAYAAEIAARVRHETRGTPDGGPSGSHSYHIITADAAGNVVSGTNTIQSLPWGDGTFVQGIPLNQIGFVPSLSNPGERVVNGLAMNIALRDGVFQFATGAFTNSVVETNLQLVLNLIEYQLPVNEAAALPRFGTFPHTLSGRIDFKSNWLDPDVDPSIVRTLRGRGLRFKQKGPLVGTGLDTGLGVVARRHANGTFSGAVAPWPGLTTGWRKGSRREGRRR